jgi:DNA-directed RNA polymerase subunit beta'
MYAMPNYDDYAYPVFGPGSGEAIRLDDAELGLDRF